MELLTPKIWIALDCILMSNSFLYLWPCHCLHFLKFLKPKTLQNRRLHIRTQCVYLCLFSFKRLSVSFGYHRYSSSSSQFQNLLPSSLLLYAKNLRPLGVFFFAANHLQKDVDILRKPTASLEQVRRWSVTFLYQPKYFIFYGRGERDLGLCPQYLFYIACTNIPLLWWRELNQKDARCLFTLRSKMHGHKNLKILFLFV